MRLKNGRQTVVLVHGQLRPEAKDKAMERFASGEAKLLEIAVKHGAPDFKSLPAAVWQAAHADVIALG